MIAGAVEAERRQRVHRRLDLGDAAGGSLDQLKRRDLAFRSRATASTADIRQSSSVIECSCYDAAA